MDTPYLFVVIVENQRTVDIELEADSDPEAYRLALLFLRMVSYRVHGGQLTRQLTPRGDLACQHLMFYKPKIGWYFGDERDHLPF